MIDYPSMGHKVNLCNFFLHKLFYTPAETKGSMSSMQLRLIEESKIHCAREHFKAISNGNVVYDIVDSYQSLLDKVMK